MEGTGKKISGFEDSSYSLSDLPIIAIGQPLSPEVMDNVVSQGDLFNNVTKEKLGDMKTQIELIVYKAWPSRTKFAPRGSKGPKVECSSPDGVQGNKGECKKCPLNSFQLRDRCTEQRSFIVAPVNSPSSLMRIIFSRSNMSVGRKLEKTLIAALNEHKIPYSFGHTIKLGTAKEKNDTTGTQYFVFTVELGSLTDKKLYSELEGYANEATELRSDSIARFKERMESGGSFEEAPEEGENEANNGADSEAEPSEDALV